jgi:hypothetical protein
MLSLVQFNLPVLLVALAIGVAAGRWIFARRPAPPERTDPDSPPS